MFSGTEDSGLSCLGLGGMFEFKSSGVRFEVSGFTTNDDASKFIEITGYPCNA